MRTRKLKDESLNVLKRNWLNVIGASLIFCIIPFIILQSLNIKALGILDQFSLYKPFSSNLIGYIVMAIVFIIQPYFVLCFIKYCSSLMNSKRRIPYIECIVHWRQYLRFLGIVIVDFMMLSVLSFLILQAADMTSSLGLSIILIILFFIEVFIVLLFIFPAGFLIVQEHTLSFERALLESLNIVRRNFFKSVYLWLSFLGWIIVGIITLGIGFIWIAPYIISTMSLFVKSKNKGFSGGFYFTSW